MIKLLLIFCISIVLCGGAERHLKDDDFVLPQPIKTQATIYYESIDEKGKNSAKYTKGKFSLYVFRTLYNVQVAEK